MSKFRALSVLAAILMLGGCGESGNIFGFDRGGPDEFSVVRNQPLSIPPNATLRPPQPGTDRSTRNQSSNVAREELVTSAPGDMDPAESFEMSGYSVRGGPSPGEAALMQRVTSYYGVEPDIRRMVDQESRQLVLEQDSFVNSLLFWRDEPPPGTELDAEAEARRLRENEALGRPANAGTSPVILRKKSGFSSLF
ncbi:MAG: DUF3035 domain-containing protein [Rhodospirillales bacterium]|nr:MAG: DUF3035 domain-containing protein [Rhodospirillales bacterium]